MLTRASIEWTMGAIDQLARTGRAVELISAPPGAAALYSWAKKEPEKFINFYLKLLERDLVAGEKIQEDTGTKASLEEIGRLLEEIANGAMAEDTQKPGG